MSKTVSQTRVVDETQSRGPIGQAQRLSAKRDPVISSSVARLFFTRGPAHIARFVMAVVIDAFNAVVFRWASADIIDKCGVILPSITDANTAATVVGKVNLCLVLTPTNHVDPDAVFLRMASVARVSVPRRFSRADFTAQATTTAMAAIDQMVAAGRDVFAAIATTPPPTSFSALNGFGLAQDRQSSEHAASEIECGNLSGSHAVSSFAGDGVVRGWRAVNTLVSLANYPTAVAV